MLHLELIPELERSEIENDHYLISVNDHYLIFEVMADKDALVEAASISVQAHEKLTHLLTTVPGQKQEGNYLLAHDDYS